MNPAYHQSVLLEEVCNYLQVVREYWYLDGTLGDGGHSLEIIRRGGKVVGVDLDPQAIQRVRRRFQAVGISEDHYQLIQGNFKDLDSFLDQGRIFNGGVLDLGVSSLQLEAPERGFSFLREGPLDMRMDPNLAVAAVDLLNGLHKGELDELIQKYGEEPTARRIAEAVVLARPLRTTTELTQIIERILPRRGRTHPATRVFQALRIAVNDELNSLKSGLPMILGRLASQSRLAVIAFHSLEDSIVKRTFSRWEDERLGRILTSKPVTPTSGEIKTNIRARSAKLRCFEKC